MVLPSLKSIKTLFGSPHRRAGSHPSRKHKEKKLPRCLEVTDGTGPLLRDSNDSTKSGHNQIHPKNEPSFDVVNGMAVNPTENTVTESTEVQMQAVNRSTQHGKESPAKARIAPFNSTKDENWSNSVIMTNEKETAEEKMAEGDVKDFLEMKVKELDRVLTLEYKNALAANEENSLSGATLVKQLEEERSLRLEAERRLRDVSCENEVSKDRLTKLQQDFTRLEEMLCGLLQYKTRIDWLQKEKATQKMSYEMKLCKYQNYVASLEKENLMLLTEVKSLETSNKQNDDRDRNLSRVLLERLRYLETENSSLVLETEQQRLQYERCLDDVANQVVQALLTQKSLREECLKLQKRVSDLEQHNRTLNLMFQRHIQLSSDSSCQKDKAFSHPSTRYSSNHSSIATQTTSQSEDSLESLASLCSEYSIHSGHSGNGGGCQGGNMMIGIPGLPKLSSPPMWIRKCLESSNWGNGAMVNHSTKSSGLGTSNFAGASASGGMDLDIGVQCTPFFDDHVWPGMRSWDLDDLVTSEDDIYVTEATSSTIQRRPPSLLVEVRSDEKNGAANSLKQMLEFSTSSDELQPPIHNPPPASLSNHLQWLPRQHTCRSTSKNRLILKRRPHSFNFASHKVAAQLNVLCRSTLPREFKFSIIESPSGNNHNKNKNNESNENSNDSKIMMDLANDEVEKRESDSSDQSCKTQNTMCSTGATRDEGYSTMSSDVQCMESLCQRAETSQEDLEEEEEGAAEMFANDLDQSLILVQVTKNVEEDCINGDEGKMQENNDDDDEELNNYDVVGNSIFVNELSIIEDGDCDEFYIPIKCPLTVNMTGVAQIHRAASDSRLNGSDLKENSLFLLSTSESCLELDKNKEKSQPFVTLQRSKGKICLTDDDEEAILKGEVEEEIRSEQCNKNEELVETGEFSMDEVITAAFSNKWFETNDGEGFEGGGTSRASWGSSANDTSGFLMLEYCSYEASCDSFDRPTNRLFDSSNDDEAKLENGDNVIKSTSTETEFCPDFYRLCQVDAHLIEKSSNLGEESEVYFKFEKPVSSEDSSSEEEEEEEEEEEVEEEEDLEEEEEEEEEVCEIVEVPDDVCSLDDSGSMREKLQELNALMVESGVDDERRVDDEPVVGGKEGCTTSWVHVEADMDLTDPKARANLLDTMLGSSASSSSSECGDDAPDYQHLHQLHRHRRRHRKVTEHENRILRYIPPLRPSIIGRRDFFFRYGEQEQAAVASFDFLEDLSTSVSDFGSAETLNAEDQRRIEDEIEVEEEKQFDQSASDRPVINYNTWDSSNEHRGSTNTMQSGVEQENVDRISLSDSCAESFSSSNQSLNTLEE